MPSHPAPTDILTRERIGNALTALTDPGANSRIDLDDAERRVIGDALQGTPHPLGGFARTLLDQWDHLDVDDQVAGLLLFSDITRHPSRRRTPGMELGR